jgi:hypothetical protein
VKQITIKTNTMTYTTATTTAINITILDAIESGFETADTLIQFMKSEGFEIMVDRYRNMLLTEF